MDNITKMVTGDRATLQVIVVATGRIGQVHLVRPGGAGTGWLNEAEDWRGGAAVVSTQAVSTSEMPGGGEEVPSETLEAMRSNQQASSTGIEGADPDADGSDGKTAAGAATSAVVMADETGTEEADGLPAADGAGSNSSSPELSFYPSENGGSDDEDDGVSHVVATGTAAGLGSGTAEIDANKVLKAGNLTKRGGSRKSWKTRWFTLTPTELRYSAGPKKAPKGLIHLATVEDVVINVDQKKKHCFSVATPERTYYIYAKTRDDMHDWIEAVNAARHALAELETAGKTVGAILGKGHKVVVKEGPLSKCDPRQKNWHKRHVTLTNNTLSYAAGKGKKTKGMVSVNEMLDVGACELAGTKKVHSFSIRTAGGRIFYFDAGSEAGRSAWLAAIESVRPRVPGAVTTVVMATSARARINTINSDSGAGSGGSIATTSATPASGPSDAGGAAGGSGGDGEAADGSGGGGGGGVIVEGHLKKQGGSKTRLKRRYFVLTSDELVYRSSETSKTAKGVIPTVLMMSAVPEDVAGGIGRGSVRCKFFQREGSGRERLPLCGACRRIWVAPTTPHPSLFFFPPRFALL